MWFTSRIGYVSTLNEHAFSQSCLATVDMSDYADVPDAFNCARLSCRFSICAGKEAISTIYEDFTHRKASRSHSISDHPLDTPLYRGVYTLGVYTPNRHLYIVLFR